MDTKLLKQKILDLAIRGKLVPQDPNDEPASVLLERIRAEKERLVAEGKIKRTKSTTDNRHYENVPFEIPDSWEWVRLSDIADVGTGATPKTNIKEYYNGDIPWITSSSTQWEIIDKPVSLISKKAVDETNCKIYKAGTIIIAMYGEGKTRGQVSELAIDSATNQACAAISLFNVELKDYVKAFLKYSYGGIRYLSVGGVQPNLNLKVIEQFKIPLPPHSEQLRIVTEIKRWFALIEDLEENKGALLEAIKQAKSKILSFAISGKLVAQDPNDEPAIELLNLNSATL